MNAREIARARAVAKAAMEGKPLPVPSYGPQVDEATLTRPAFVIGYLAGVVRTLADALEQAEAKR